MKLPLSYLLLPCCAARWTLRLKKLLFVIAWYLTAPHINIFLLNFWLETENNKRPMCLDALLIWWPVIKGLEIMVLGASRKQLLQITTACNVTSHKKREIWSIKARNKVTLTWYLNKKKKIKTGVQCPFLVTKVAVTLQLYEV